MRKYIVGFFVLALAAVAVLPLFGADLDPAQLREEREKANLAMADMKAADPELNSFFENAYGFVVFGEIGKGAFIFGGAHGRGIVWQQGTIVGNASVTKVTVGAQIGGMTYSQVIFFKDKAAMDRFKEDKLEFSASVAAVIIQSGAAKGATYTDGVAVFLMAPKGAMLDASVGGQKFSYSAD